MQHKAKHHLRAGDLLMRADDYLFTEGPLDANRRAALNILLDKAAACYRAASEVK